MEKSVQRRKNLSKDKLSEYILSRGPFDDSYYDGWTDEIQMEQPLVDLTPGRGRVKNFISNVRIPLQYEKLLLGICLFYNI